MNTALTRLLLAAVLTAAAGPVALRAQTSMVPNAMSYQGVLTDSAGDVVAPSTPENRNIEFRIYDAATGGNVLWAEAQTVTVFKGNFSVILGNGTAIGAPSGPAAFAAVFTNATSANRYFGITPQGGAEFAPRQQLLASAYALRAKQAESVNATAQANGTPSQFNWLNANNLTVNGPAKISGNNTLEFGSGISGKEPSAGEISYGKYTTNSLDIVGAGNTVPSRSVTIFAEGGTAFTGPIKLPALDGQWLRFGATENYGIGKGAPSMLYFRSDSKFSWFNGVTAPVELASLSPAGFTLSAGKFTGDGSGLTNVSPPADYNYLGVKTNGVLEFGLNVPGKQQDAGKIGYKTYSVDALDIIGAGTDGSNRKIKLWAEGGLVTTGAITSSGAITASSVTSSGAIVAANTTLIDADAIVWAATNWGIESEPNFLQIYSGDGLRAALSRNGPSGFTFSSDRRLKQDIQPLTGALAGLLALKPSTYHFKSAPDAPLSMGLIAQEVQEVYPELVSFMGSDKQTLGIAYDGFIPVLIAAAQEQQAQIESLKTENASLQDRVSALEAKLEAVLSRLPATQ
jgi:hypothetical protein